MIFLPILLIFGAATGIGLSADSHKKAEIARHKTVYTRVNRIKSNADYSAREDVLTAGNYCERMRYNVEVCWKVERTK